MQCALQDLWFAHGTWRTSVRSMRAHEVVAGVRVVNTRALRLPAGETIGLGASILHTDAQPRSACPSASYSHGFAITHAKADSDARQRDPSCQAEPRHDKDTGDGLAYVAAQAEAQHQHQGVGLRGSPGQ